MTRAEVINVVREELPASAITDTLYGIELSPGHARICSGGGIAGNLGVWWMVDKRTGDKVYPHKICSVSALRRAVKYWLACVESL